MTNTSNTQVEVNLTDLHLIDNDMTFDFCESDIKVKICLYRTKDFSTKYGKRVKALGGTFTHCRGHNYDRWVTLPAPFFREVREGHPAPFAAEVRELERLDKLNKLIFDLLTDSALWASPACEADFRDFQVHVPCQWSDGTGHMLMLKRWGNPVDVKAWFALTLRNSRDMIDSLQKTGKAVFNKFTGSVWVVESHTGHITGNNAEWGLTKYERSTAEDTPAETPAEVTEAPAEELLTIEFTAWATEYVAGYVSQTGLQWVEHNKTVNDENGEQRAWVRNGYTGTTEQFAVLAWYLTQERQRCNLDPSYKRSLTMTLKKLPAPVDPATVNTPAPAEAPAEVTEAPVTRISFNDRAFSEIMPLVKEHNLPLTDVCVQSGVLGSNRQQVNLFFEGTEKAFSHLAFFLTELLEHAETAGLLPIEQEVVACALQSLPAPVDPYAEERVAEVTETPSEATEDTNTTPDLLSAEELESDAFKAFAAEMKALLADVPDALPADMSDAHTMLCVQFSVDKRQYNPCREYEWTTELAQCGGELTVQQGIMQFTVPLQTFRQRELFKTLHKCSLLEDPEMEGARQYLFTQVVLPLARWGCDAQPQVNTALVECMYYENAFTLIEEGYKACREKLQ